VIGKGGNHCTTKRLGSKSIEILVPIPKQVMKYWEIVLKLPGKQNMSGITIVSIH